MTPERDAELPGIDPERGVEVRVPAPKEDVATPRKIPVART